MVRPVAVRTRKRDTTALVAGSAVSGLLAYVLFAVTTRALGPHEAAPVSVLWSYWSLAGAAFTFPLQHWIARSVTVHGEGTVRRALPRLWLVMVGASSVMGGLAWLGRELLFHRDDPWFPLLVAVLTLGSGLMGMVRGGLSARRRFVGLAWSFVAENGVRAVAVGALALAAVDSAVPYGVALVAGHLVAFLWSGSLHFGRQRVSKGAGPFAFLTGAGLAQLLAQIVLTGGPVVLALAGGSPAEVTALFAALALFRAPYILALGLVSQLTGLVTGMVVAGQFAQVRRIQRRIVATTVVFLALAGIGGASVGPGLLRLIFGDDVGFAPGQSAVVAMASTLAVANLVVMISALALSRPRAVAASWAVAVLAGAVGIVAPSPLSPPAQAVWCFLLAEAVAFTCLCASGVRRIDAPAAR